MPPGEAPKALPQRALVEMTTEDDGLGIDEVLDELATDEDRDADRVAVELDCDTEHFPKRGLHPFPQWPSVLPHQLY